MVLLPRIHLPGIIPIQLDVVDRTQQRTSQQRHRFRQWGGSQPLADIRLEQLDTLASPVDSTDFFDYQSIHRDCYWYFYDDRILL
jgi:hypothetical protein